MSSSRGEAAARGKACRIEGGAMHTIEVDMENASLISLIENLQRKRFGLH